VACGDSKNTLTVEIHETFASGNQMSTISPCKEGDENTMTITLKPPEKFQNITGFGGAFTASSAYRFTSIMDMKVKKPFSERLKYRSFEF
jgi:glucosylceramidase